MYSHLWDRCTGIHTYGSGATCIHTYGSGATGIHTQGSGATGIHTYGSGETGIHTKGSGTTGIHTYGTGTTGIHTYGTGTTGIHTFGTGAQVFTLMDQVQQASINLSIFSSQQNNSRQKHQGTSNNFYVIRIEEEINKNILDKSS